MMNLKWGMVLAFISSRGSATREPRTISSLSHSQVPMSPVARAMGHHATLSGKASTSTIRMICKRSKESLRDGPGSDLAECLPDKSKQQFWASKPCNCVLQVEKCEKVENLLPVLPGFFGLLPPYQWWFLLMISRCRSPCPRTLV